MTRKMAEALATVLGGNVNPLMPESREHGVEFDRPDGKFVAIDGDAAYVFPARRSYDRYHADGFQGTIPDAAGWHDGGWGSAEWAEGFAFAVGGHEVLTGGHVWCVGVELPDGRYVLIGDESASVFPSRGDFESCNADEATHFEFV